MDVLGDEAVVVEVLLGELQPLEHRRRVAGRVGGGQRAQHEPVAVVAARLVRVERVGVLRENERRAGRVPVLCAALGEACGVVAGGVVRVSDRRVGGGGQRRRQREEEVLDDLAVAPEVARHVGRGGGVAGAGAGATTAAAAAVFPLDFDGVARGARGAVVPAVLRGLAVLAAAAQHEALHDGRVDAADDSGARLAPPRALLVVGACAPRLLVRRDQHLPPPLRPAVRVVDVVAARLQHHVRLGRGGREVVEVALELAAAAAGGGRADERAEDMVGEVVVAEDHRLHRHVGVAGRAHHAEGGVELGVEGVPEEAAATLPQHQRRAVEDAGGGGASSLEVHVPVVVSGGEAGVVVRLGGASVAHRAEHEAVFAAAFEWRRGGRGRRRRGWRRRRWWR